MTSNDKIRTWSGRPTFWLGLILLVGSAVRLTALDSFPPGLHQDEAYSAYNAYSVMNYGIDSYGYTRPVYYTVWGSGMSVLYSYLTMPFFALFGISTITIRLPQAILGCISILAVYGLGKELNGSRFGLLFAALLAVNPWHIQQSRFGLDANLAVPMLLFAVCFLCRYLNGRRNSVWPCALFFGLTLYCYAITWLLVPALLVLSLIAYRRRIRFDRNLAGAILLLFLLALPLLLFLAVNFGWIPELRTDLLSVPRLPAIRTDEISTRGFKAGFLWLLAMLWRQHDDIWWITTPSVGAYYYISTPFILLGILIHLWTLTSFLRGKMRAGSHSRQQNQLSAAEQTHKTEGSPKSPSGKTLPLHFIMALWFVSMFLIGCSIDNAKYYKINCLHIPVIFYCAWGAAAVMRRWRQVWIRGAVLVCYGCFFVYFLYGRLTLPVSYEEYGNPLLSHTLWTQYEEAIDYAEALTDGDIGISGLNYSNFMLYKKINPYDYMEQVTYEGASQTFRTVTTIGRYHFIQPVPGQEQIMVYLLPPGSREDFLAAGYTVEQINDCYYAAYLPGKVSLPEE